MQSTFFNFILTKWLIFRKNYEYLINYTVKTIGIYACGENVSRFLAELLYFVEAGTHIPHPCQIAGNDCISSI